MAGYGATDLAGGTLELGVPGQRLPSPYRAEAEIARAALESVKEHLSWPRVIATATPWIEAIRRDPAPFWALEMLLLFFLHPDRDWRREMLVRELRGSDGVVREALASLEKAGLVSETSPQTFRLAAIPPDLRKMIDAVSDLYSTRPMAVIKAISGSPSSSGPSSASP